MDHMHAALPVVDAEDSAVDTARGGDFADAYKAPYAENAQDERDAAGDAPRMAPSAAQDVKERQDDVQDVPVLVPLGVLDVGDGRDAGAARSVASASLHAVQVVTMILEQRSDAALKERSPVHKVKASPGQKEHSPVHKVKASPGQKEPVLLVAFPALEAQFPAVRRLLA
jgi:hypothetical protein